MKVSICITAYNHEKFIEQAIQSVLMQVTDFNYEILIGEDDSDDNTREIVKRYKKKYPDKICLFLNDRRNVIHIDGRPTGRWNFVNNIVHAKGKYIALLDGDDCWTSNTKLQKQVNILDADNEIDIAFHAAKVCNFKKKCNAIQPLNLKKTIYDYHDLISEGNFIYTSSVMFRNQYWKQLPIWFYQVSMGDYPLYLLLCNNKLFYDHTIMSIYRVHSGGLWNSQNSYIRELRSIKSYRIIHTNLNNSKLKSYKHSILHRIYIIFLEAKKNKVTLPKAIFDILFNNRYTYNANTKYEAMCILRYLTKNLVDKLRQ